MPIKFLETGSLDREKKLLVIYNPNSGRQVGDKKKKIMNALISKGLNYEFYETTAQYDGMKKIQEMDVSEYSGVVAVGGDGTVNECINGMLTRTGDKIPMGFMPNGSGDDFCKSIGIPKGDIDVGLQFVQSCTTIKVDIIKLLIDYDTEEELDAAIRTNATIKKHEHLRYACANTWFGLSAIVADRCAWMKPLIGGTAYDVQAVKELAAGTSAQFDIDVDTASLKGSDEEGMTRWKTDLDTNIFMAFNGKYGGGGAIFLPGAMVNDGYFDLTVRNGPIGFLDGVALKDLTKAGGLHAYDDNLDFIRIKKMRVMNKELDGDKNPIMQPINIDGEILNWTKFVNYEIVPNALEVLVDMRTVINSSLEAGL